MLAFRVDCTSGMHDDLIVFLGCRSTVVRWGCWVLAELGWESIQPRTKKLDNKHWLVSSYYFKYDIGSIIMGLFWVY